jgi:hypothetical protein
VARRIPLDNLSIVLLSDIGAGTIDAETTSFQDGRDGDVAASVAVGTAGLSIGPRRAHGRHTKDGQRVRFSSGTTSIPNHSLT